MERQVNFLLALSLATASASAFSPELHRGDTENTLSITHSSNVASNDKLPFHLALGRNINPDLALKYNTAFADELDNTVAALTDSDISQASADTPPTDEVTSSEPISEPVVSQTVCSTVFDLPQPVSVEGVDPRLPTGLNVKSLTGRVFPVPPNTRVIVEARFRVEKQDLSDGTFQRGVWTFGNGLGGPGLIRNFMGNNVNETVFLEAIGFEELHPLLNFGDYISRTARDVALVLESDGIKGAVGAKETDSTEPFNMRGFSNPKSIYDNGRQIASGITSQANTRTTSDKLNIQFCSV